MQKVKTLRSELASLRHTVFILLLLNYHMKFKVQMKHMFSSIQDLNSRVKRFAILLMRPFILFIIVWTCKNWDIKGRRFRGNFPSVFFFWPFLSCIPFWWFSYLRLALNVHHPVSWSDGHSLHTCKLLFRHGNVSWTFHNPSNFMISNSHW